MYRYHNNLVISNQKMIHVLVNSSEEEGGFLTYEHGSGSGSGSGSGIRIRIYGSRKSLESLSLEYKRERG